MKKKTLLMTLALAAATLTAAGQTVTPDRETPIAPADLTQNALANATTLTISGEWTAEQVTTLRAAIAGDNYGSNAVLTTVTFDPDAKMGSMEFLFNSCTALTGVTMPTATNSDPVSFTGAFRNCTALKGTIDLSKFTAISGMNSAFALCSMLEGVTMPTETNSNPVDFSSAFHGCKALKSIDLSKFTAISGMASAFNGCTVLESVTMPTETNNRAVPFNNAFYDCKALKTVDLSKFTAISNMGSAFRGCTALTGVAMPTARNTTSVNFWSAFQNCTALAGNINLSGFTNISNMNEAFNGCTALTGVTMPTTPNTTSVNFENAFYGCTALAGNINLSGFTAISNMSSAFCGCTALESVAMPTTPNSAPVSFQSAFYSCKALQSVDLSKFTAISNMASAFNGCILLESVTMPTETNTAGVSFGSAFYGCKALQSVDLSKFTAISSMSSAFNGCTALEGVTLPDANTAPDGGVSFRSAFRNCTALTGIVDVSGFTNIKSMESAFEGCTGITGVKFSATENTTAGNFLSAFSGCTALQSVDLSRFTAISDMASTFLNCTSLTSVKLGGALPATTTYAFSQANLNCLVYVPAGWGAKPSGWYIIYIPGGTADGNITLKEIELIYYYLFHCPEAFSLGAGNTMSYTRELLHRNQWATVCLPFTAAVPADCIAKELSSSTETSVTFAEVQTMQANKPYIVAYTGSSIRRDVTFTSEPGVTIEATPAKMQTETATYSMVGTYTDIIEQSMYLLGDNSFLLYNHGNLHPFRAYITATGGAPNQAPSLAIGNEGDATGIGCIESPEAEAIPALSHVYTIDGRLVKTVPAEEYSMLKQGLERGVYIVNGQKVTVTE